MDARRSTRSQARIAGFLIIIVAGAVGYTMHSTLFVGNDAAATAGNILASEQKWRLSFAAMLVMLACDVAVAAILYVLFKPVSRSLSLIACALRLVLVAIVGVSILGRYAVLLLFEGHRLGGVRDRTAAGDSAFIQQGRLGAAASRR